MTAPVAYAMGMVWHPRPFYAIAMLMASLPPLLSAHFAQPPSAPAVVSAPIGLTLGQDGGRGIVVTSLRSDGPAERDGIAVGDRLRAIAGRPVMALPIARRLLDPRGGCGIMLSLDRGGIPYHARIWQCGRTGAG